MFVQFTQTHSNVYCCQNVGGYFISPCFFHIPSCCGTQKEFFQHYTCLWELTVFPSIILFFLVSKMYSSSPFVSHKYSIEAETMFQLLYCTSKSNNYLLFPSLVASPPSDVTAVQDGPTSIRVSWTPPSPLRDTTGYRISYTGGGSVDVDGGNTNSHTLTGLINGQTYTISIVGTSSSSGVLPSAPVSAGTVGLGKIYYTSICHCFCKLL